MMTSCTGGVISSGFVVSLPTTVGRFFIKKRIKLWIKNRKCI